MLNSDSRILKDYIKRHSFHINVSGFSMIPTLVPNDKVFLQKILFNQIKINDIVYVNDSKKQFIHRVIYKTKNYLITKGDNNLVSDGKIYPTQIIGKVYQIKRNNQIFDLENLYLLQSTHYFQEIIKVKKAFEKEKINYVFLKGLPLHLYFEKSHPKRIYADCDILINKQKFNEVQKLLIKYGYNPTDASLSKIHTFLRKKLIEKSFCRKIINIFVIFDVHLEIDWMSPQIGRLNEIYPQELIDKFTTELLLNKQSVYINKERFPILRFIFLTLYLALHFFHHNFRGSFRLELLDKIIRRVIKDSKKVSNLKAFHRLTLIIQKYGLQNFVYPVFILLKKYYHTPLTKTFLNSIKSDKARVKYINSNILNINIFDDESRIHSGINRFRNLFFLSPNPLWRRLLIIFNIQVIYSFLWVIIFFVKRSLIKKVTSF